MKILIVVICIIFIPWCVLRILGVPASLNLLPSFLPGEEVLFFKRWVWVSSGKSWPKYYRWGFSLPPFMESGMYVTDRRVLYVHYLFRSTEFEFSQWFEGKQGAGNNELVKKVSCGKSWLLGSYLEVVSDNSVKQWCRSPQMRIRLFMKNPEPVCRIIAEAMLQNHEGSQCHK